MLVYFGTVNRGAPPADGGELVALDWSTREVLGRMPVRPEDPDLEDDPNRRGGGRGCRGIAFHDGDVLAASYHSIYRADRDLDSVSRLSGGLMVGLHEIALGDDGLLWVAATAIDMALGYRPDGSLARFHAPRADPRFQRALGLEPLDIDLDADNRERWMHRDVQASASHLHLNAVAPVGERVLALFNRFGVIADLTEGRIVARDGALERGHNLEVLDDGTLVSLDTHGRTVRFYDPSDGSLVHVVDLMTFPEVRALRRSVKKSERPALAKPLFTRGLAFAGRVCFVGTSPAAILQIGWEAGDVLDIHRHSDDVRVAIHGLAVPDRTG